MDNEITREELKKFFDLYLIEKNFSNQQNLIKIIIKKSSFIILSTITLSGMMTFITEQRLITSLIAVFIFYTLIALYLEFKNNESGYMKQLAHVSKKFSFYCIFILTISIPIMLATKGVSIILCVIIEVLTFVVLVYLFIYLFKKIESKKKVNILLLKNKVKMYNRVIILELLEKINEQENPYKEDFKHLKPKEEELFYYSPQEKKIKSLNTRKCEKKIKNILKELKKTQIIGRKDFDEITKENKDSWSKKSNYYQIEFKENKKEVIKLKRLN